ncbi:MAG: 3-phosphoshikimate 1-carboxyvinyltransferase [Gammaproteobacteria bacterium]|nr:3-phosphoshikimate 1-carboxyvinyltransferase [Gammaproteobacteria bacterium]MDH5305013.1 3-phosphoshikimate 1-carboxyvinyltransferase [Gammaproteobacteria bacterium]
MRFEVQPSRITDAKLTVPGDKSVSHRALMLGGIAEGRTSVSGFLAGEDCLATLEAMSRMGITIARPAATELIVHGAGLQGLVAPTEELDLGNSGTAMRLMAGLLSGQNFTTVLTGDASLSLRPMQRVIGPLERMGATIESNAGRPPLIVHGNPVLRGIDYTLPVASAQVKSAVLLAGLYADGVTTVKEPAVTRDHTERMLVTMGAEVDRVSNRISLRGHQTLRGSDIAVPADLSSASFVMLAATLAERADVLITGVGINPTRTGVIDILQAMGASIGFENRRLFGAEPVADIRVRSSRLRGGVIDPALVSLAIDEFPVLFVAAAAAVGKTVFSGLAELRVKESDRISAMAAGLRALGIQVEEVEDGATVYGGKFIGGVVESHGDHRVAMSLAVAGTVATDTVVINDVATVNTSFPGFTSCLQQLGAAIR